MNLFTIFMQVGVVLFTVLLIYLYASKSTPIYVLVFVFIGYSLGFALVVLIPYDIATVIITQTLSDDKSRQENLVVIWDIIYWTVFVLCWLVLPVMQEFQVAGDFSFSARLKTAVWRHVRLFIIAGGLGLVCLIYLLIKGSLSV